MDSSFAAQSDPILSEWAQTVDLLATLERIPLSELSPSVQPPPEPRQPLGIAIVGGLIDSRFFTLFTTPVVYLYLDQFIVRRKYQIS